MEPIPFEAEQVALLPENVKLVTYAKDQPQYRPLPVVKFTGPEGRVMSRWSFTPEERERIAKGEDLYLEQLTFPHPRCPSCGHAGQLQPILPTVGMREFCPADPQVAE